MTFTDEHFDLVASAIHKAELGAAWHELTDEERSALTAHTSVVKEAS